MPRIVKAPEDRRAEILDTAERLFRQLGYEACSVEAIIREIGIAKGTFYHHFRSKEQILDAIVTRALDALIAQAEAVADAPALSAMDKMAMLLSGAQVGDEANADAHAELADMMHRPQNRALHERTNIQTVLRLSPVLARIVEQGNREGVFTCAAPLETVQFLLTGAQFLLDGGMFDFSGEEIAARREAAQHSIEKSLGAAPGQFSFMTR